MNEELKKHLKFFTTYLLELYMYIYLKKKTKRKKLHYESYDRFA